MKTNFLFPYRERISSLALCTLIVLLLASTQLWAQQSKLPCNGAVSTPFTSASFTPSSLTATTTSNNGFGIVYWENGNNCGFPAIPPCGPNGKNNVVNASTTDFARVHFLSAGGSASLRVTETVNEYSAGNFAGFVIKNSSVLGADLLGTITITTYNGGVFSEERTANSLIGVNSSLITEAYEVGFYTTKPFDAIEISFGSLASADTYDVYYAVQRGFCPPTTSIACKTLTPVTAPDYPVYINPLNTGITAAACVGCAISNTSNILSSTATAPATIDLAASALSSAKISVANALETYAAGTYAGFDIGSSTLANINLLGSVQITLYNNGTAVQSGAGTSLLAGATLLSGSRQVVGTVAKFPFDEVQISFNQVASLNPLGEVSVYRALIQTACPTTVSCNQTLNLNTGPTSAVVEGTRTGFSGIASINGSFVRDPFAAVSSSTTDFARISNLASGATTGSISIADPATVYPAGTFAGYTIRTGNFLVSTALLPYLTVRTYLDGVQQESNSSNDLLTLSVFLQIFGTPGEFSNIGFVATKPFDEIQLSVGSLVGALANYVDVYGAFIDTRNSCSASLNPDFNVTLKGVSVLGNVSTNDNVSLSTYGTPVAAGTNPLGASIILTLDGAYTFTATTIGTYTYTVPICTTGQTDCPTTTLTIRVLDPAVATNPPVANPDYASVQSATATPGNVTINVRANDGPAKGGTLSVNITVGPTHGTALVNGSGNVVYTPNAGYIGNDVLTYQICETPDGTLCSTAQVTVHVVPAGNSTVTIVDDYGKIKLNASISGNVLANDQGSGLTVSNAGTTTFSQGTLELSANGAYTFTPATGISGPVDFTYSAGGSAATLHIVVVPVSDLAPTLYTRPNAIKGNKPITVQVDVLELKGVITSGTVTVRINKDSRMNLDLNSSTTTFDGKAMQNGSWDFSSDQTHYILTSKSGVTIPAYGQLSFVLDGNIAPEGTSGSMSVSVVIDAGSGDEVKNLNNTDADVIDYFQQ